MINLIGVNFFSLNPTQKLFELTQIRIFQVVFVPSQFLAPLHQSHVDMDNSNYKHGFIWSIVLKKMHKIDIFGSFSGIHCLTFILRVCDLQVLKSSTYNTYEGI